MLIIDLHDLPVLMGRSRDRPALGESALPATYYATSGKNFGRLRKPSRKGARTGGPARGRAAVW
ncbi:hypothetical protein GCM10027028_33610 [Streptomyces sundarbansensis]